MNDRSLTTKQHEALDRIAETQPETTVVGWIGDDKVGRGPILRAGDGSRRLLNFTGRLKKIG